MSVASVASVFVHNTASTSELSVTMQLNKEGPKYKHRPFPAFSCDLAARDCCCGTIVETRQRE